MGMQLFGKNYTGSNLKENLASLIKELSFIINYSASHNRNFYTGLDSTLFSWRTDESLLWLYNTECGSETQTSLKRDTL